MIRYIKKREKTYGKEQPVTKDNAAGTGVSYNHNNAWILISNKENFDNIFNTGARKWVQVRMEISSAHSSIKSTTPVC